jgi:hypothetical protein
MKLDLATFRALKFDRAALKGFKLDAGDLRRRALKLKEKLRNRAVVTITFFSGETGVRLVKREGDQVRSETRLFLPLGAEHVLAQPENFGAELATLLSAHGVRERQCVVCLPPAWAFTHSTDVPELSGEDLRGYIELKAEKEFPMAVSELRLAHSAFILPDGRRRVTVAAVPAKRVAAVEQMLAKAGCKLASLSLGLDNLLALPEAPSRVHFLANGNHVDVIITAGGGVAGVRTLPTGVAPPDPAFDTVSFCREVRLMLGRLPADLRQGVSEATFGGTPDSAESLCAKTRPLLHRMGLSTPQETERVTPVGLEAAERFLRDQPATFEFVTPEVKKWQVWVQKFDSRRRRAFLGGGVALVVLPILTFMYRSHVESNLVEEWRDMRPNVEKVKALQAKIRRFRPWFDTAPQVLQAIETLAGAFSENGDTWAKSIQIHDGQRVTCTSFAKTQQAKDQMLDRLRKKKGVVELQTQQVRGNSPITFTFTYKWEPAHAN